MNGRQYEALVVGALEDLDTRIRPTLDKLGEGAEYSVSVAGIVFRAFDLEKDDASGIEGSMPEWVVEYYYHIEDHPVVRYLESRTGLAMCGPGQSRDDALEAVVAGITVARGGSHDDDCDDDDDCDEGEAWVALDFLEKLLHGLVPEGWSVNVYDDWEGVHHSYLEIVAPGNNDAGYRMAAIDTHGAVTLRGGDLVGPYNPDQLNELLTHTMEFCEKVAADMANGEQR